MFFVVRDDYYFWSGGCFVGVLLYCEIGEESDGEGDFVIGDYYFDVDWYY